MRFRDALFTDLYQLTMMQSYLREGMTAEATFSLFVRRLGTRSFLVAAGLEQALAFLEDVHFDESALDYLAGQEQFDAAFVDALANFSFTGTVRAVPEGTPVFPEEPLVEVTAPLPEAQLVETFLLNQLTFQTNVATKARRVKDAAGDATVADFAARRTHGTDASLAGARAMYIGGVDATSNVRAGQRYGLPITGTMAHSYVEAHTGGEQAAFRNFAALYPDTTLLVDTYDTLEGVRKVIRLVEEEGMSVGALRLDSGDLGALAREARALLDEAGLEDVALFASGGLDEFEIRRLLEEENAPLDGFGVGTSMGVVRDQPALDSAYKLCAYDGQPRMKLSSQKSNLPGRKQVFRFAEEEDGPVTEWPAPSRDVIATAEEDHPGARPLLQRVMAGGERTEAGQAKPAEEIRAYAAEAVDALPERLRALDAPDDPYPVALSDAMEARLRETRARLEEQMGTRAGGG